jgi:hypothetical protein
VKEVLWVTTKHNDVFVVLKLAHANNAVSLLRNGFLLLLRVVFGGNFNFILTILHGDQVLDVAIQLNALEVLINAAHVDVEVGHVAEELLPHNFSFWACVCVWLISGPFLSLLY